MSDDGVRAAVVTVGDELLLGETVDTNSAWLGRSLAALGIPVARRYTVGDDRADIGDAVEAAIEIAELVVVSGGLGPTRDDITRESVASRLGLELRLDDGVLAELVARYARRGRPFPDTNRRQAMVPDGARVLANPKGTAPGLAIGVGSRMIALLPGVPEELRAIFQGDLGQLVRARFADRLVPVHQRLIHTTGIPESEIARRLEEILPDDLGAVRLAYLPDLHGVDLRLTALGVTEAEARARFDEIERSIGPALAGGVFVAESGDLAEAVTDTLRRRGLVLAVAESCTGGLVARRMTERAGASDVFVGAVVAYDNAVKETQLGVSRETLAREGAVSEAVAVEMARGVAERLGAGAAVAVTGIAGPGGGTAEKPVGTVWLAALAGERVVTRHLALPGDRAQVRERAAQAALALLFEVLAADDGG